MHCLEKGRNERMREIGEKIFLNVKYFVGEYIDDEGFYVKTKYRKVEQWAFYLRFIGQWFFPCVKCQHKVKSLLFCTEIRLSPDNTRIGFAQNVDESKNKIDYTFVMPFIHMLPFYEFKPCPECQKVLRQTILESTTITLGNKDYMYPVELSRKNEDDDNSYKTVAKHKATKEEKEQFDK